jgi:hypothetical protein
MKRRRIFLASVLLVWGLSWLFGRDIIKGLEQLGVLPRRGLVLSDGSDFVFSLVVLAVLLSLWAMWRLFAALGGRMQPAAERSEDPRYQELLRQKESLLRDLKDLEFDRDLRKISPEDYGAIDKRLRREATAILQALDEVDPVRLYADRIREDLKKYLAGDGSAALAPASSEAESAWRREVLDRPLYRELAPVLGERDLLLAALRDQWVETAEVDRGKPASSVLTVFDRPRSERFTCTLAELRRRLLAELQQGDERETLRLAGLAGMGREECPPAELREKVLRALSQELLA